MSNIKEFENKIILGDCIEIMKKIPSNSIDLIFADPPYFMQLRGDLYRPNQSKVDAVNDEWDKFNSFAEYDKFTKNWLTECYRILKENGSFWTIGSYHNIFRVGKEMQDIGFWILNDIVWLKHNPMPNFKGTRFNNAHETLIWATKSKNSKYTFHYKSMKSFNDDVQMRSDWYLPICQGEERLKDEKGLKVHTTQKPIELLFRILISTSNENDVIFDPFLGTGTTAAAAKRLGRKYIGIEKDKKYVDASLKRLEKINKLDKSLLEYKIEIKEPLVGFGSLIEKGMIKAGQELIDKKGNIAKINIDSSIELEDGFVGSIHKTGAYLQKKESCNGWEYWYLINNGKKILINEIRKMYRVKYL